MILVDQRGCNRSTPVGELSENTIDDLVADFELIRKHLGIERWHLFGGSWGSTLSLYYAIKHPEVAKTLTIRGIWLMEDRYTCHFCHVLPRCTTHTTTTHTMTNSSMFTDHPPPPSPATWTGGCTRWHTSTQRATGPLWSTYRQISATATSWRPTGSS